MGRSPGNKTYSKQELALLLAVLEEVLPISSQEWAQATDQYAAMKECSWGDRTTLSLRQKFAQLWSTLQPDNYPTLRALARSIPKARINMRYASLVGQRRAGFDGYQQSGDAGVQRGCEGWQSHMSQRVNSADFRVPTIQQRYISEDTTNQSPSQMADTQQCVAMAVTTEAVNEPTEVRQLSDAETSQHEDEVVFVSQDHSSADYALRPSLMELYHEIIQLAVKAQLDTDRKEVEREKRESEERQGRLERQQKMMSLVAALVKSKPS